MTTTSSSSVKLLQQHEKQVLQGQHLEEFIFTLSCMTGPLLLSLPMKMVDGIMVPTAIFSGHLLCFRAFILCLYASHYTSLCSILFRDKHPKLAAICRPFASGALLLATIIFTWAAALLGGFSCLVYLLRYFLKVGFVMYLVYYV